MKIDEVERVQKLINLLQKEWEMQKERSKAENEDNAVKMINVYY